MRGRVPKDRYQKKKKRGFCQKRKRTKKVGLHEELSTVLRNKENKPLHFWGSVINRKKAIKGYAKLRKRRRGNGRLN